MGRKDSNQNKSTEHEIIAAHKTKITRKKHKDFPCLIRIDVVFILLMNVKIPTVIGKVTFMSMKNCMISRVQHEQRFITCGQRYIYSVP